MTNRGDYNSDIIIEQMAIKIDYSLLIVFYNV